MKRETLRHPKAYELAACLGCDRPTALGYLTLLWDYAGEVAPQGDIGKWTDGAISLACDWQGDAEHFIAALVQTRWLDRHETHRLVIHDWPDHCERWVKAKLDRAEMAFLDVYAQRAHDGRTPDALSNPIQSKPNQSEPLVRAPHRDEPDGSELPVVGSADYAFPLATSSGQTEFVLSAAKLAEYRDSYPHLDVDAELRKARQWLRDNPERRKTGQRGTLSFLTRWLNRAQNSGGGKRGGAQRNATRTDEAINRFLANGNETSNSTARQLALRQQG